MTWLVLILPLQNMTSKHTNQIMNTLTQNVKSRVTILFMTSLIFAFFIGKVFERSWKGEDILPLLKYLLRYEMLNLEKNWAPFVL